MPAEPASAAPVRRAPVVPALTFAWESFRDIARELPPIFRRHWQEIALNRDVVKLDPNWDFYFACDANNALAITTARNKSKHLVGYIFTLVGPHPHYVSTVYGVTDMFWLDPKYRRGWEPVHMFKRHLRGLKKGGVTVHQISHKIRYENQHGQRVARLFEYLGYNRIEEVFARVL